jgi:hypothetical protein
LNDLSEETLTTLDDVELLHRVDAIVSQLEELDPHEAGEALGALVQELGERHSPDMVLAHFRRLLEERDAPNEVLVRELATVQAGMARRAALRGHGTSRS